MARLIVLATAGAGGDLHPLMAVTLGLRERGHQITVLGDEASAGLARAEGFEAIPTDPAYDLGPQLVRAVRDSMALPAEAQGPLVQHRLASWSSEFAASLQRVVAELRPDLLLTSLFGIAVARGACAPSSIPWAVINSTFYVGPNPPRPLELDFSSRAVELFRYFMGQLADAPLVLHAVDQHFDYDHADLPPTHHYVGPLFWEEDTPAPEYLEERGDPWVLVTISSQVQDDLLIAQEALLALAHLPVRVLLTVGPGHSVEDLQVVPGNARVERYVSHDKVLSNCSLLISHAGHGAVMKALRHGVPTVLIPWGRDQPGVAARAERLGAAVVVERDRLPGPALTEAIEEAMDPRYREAAGRMAERLRANDAAAAACAHIENLLLA